MNLNDVINILTIFQLFSLSLFLFIVGKRRLSNRFLAIFFLVESMCVLNTMIIRHNGWFTDNFPYLISFPGIILKLWGPAFYLYVKSMTESEFKPGKKDIFHLSPAILYLGFLFYRYLFPNLALKFNFLQNGIILSGSDELWVIIITQTFNFSYIFLSLKKLYKFEYEVKNNYSSLNKVTLRWLRFVTYCFSILWSFDIINFVFRQITGSHTFLIYIAYPIVFILSIYAAFHAWIFPDIFLFPLRNSKHEKYPLTEKQKKDYLTQLEVVMACKKPFLKSDLTLNELSEISSIPVRYLSQILNDSLNRNFYEYINEYRVKEAEKYLRNAQGLKTILEIVYEVGFNSKSSFNAAFKKYTGMTPTSYKKSF